MPSQCVPICRAYHHHVLVPAELGQALSVVVRFHLMILSTACHDFAFRVQCFPFRCLTCAFKSPPTTMQHRDGAAFTILSAQSYILSVAQSPIGGGWSPISKRSNFAVLILIAPPLPCTLATREATSRICQNSQRSSLTATMSPACRFVPDPFQSPTRTVCVQQAHCVSRESSECVAVYGSFEG